MPTLDRVFVYGTLRAGQSNAHWLARATCLGPAKTAPTYTLLDTGPFPAAVPGGRTALVGEVYRVDATTFADLDVLEGYPDWYGRTVIDTHVGPAWIYLWAGTRDPDWPAIDGGDWTRRSG